MRGGWIKLHRQLLDKAIWQCSTPEQKTILITLLMMANHERKEWEWKGKKFVCEPGQFVTSLSSIVKNAGKGITIQNVRTALEKFKKYEFLTYESTKTGRLITIENWGIYQSEDEKLTKKSTKHQQRANKELTTNKNDKNDKNNIYTVDFEKFWSVYPGRRIGKKPAAIKWHARLKEGVSPEELIKAAQKYAQRCKLERVEEKFIMRAETFLGPNERWKDWLGWQPSQPKTGKEAPGGGVPNAGAYKPIDPEDVKRWKELNRDIYD